MNDEREAMEELEGSLFVESSIFQTNEALRKTIHIVTGLLVGFPVAMGLPQFTPSLLTETE